MGFWLESFSRGFFTAALGFNQTVSTFATAEVTWAILLYPEDHWTLKTGYFQDLIPAIQVRSPFHWRVLPILKGKSWTWIYSARFGETLPLLKPYYLTLHQPFWGFPCHLASRWTPQLGSFMDLLQGFLSSLGCAKTAWVEHHSFFGHRKQNGKKSRKHHWQCQICTMNIK